MNSEYSLYSFTRLTPEIRQSSDFPTLLRARDESKCLGPHTHQSFRETSP